MVLTVTRRLPQVGREQGLGALSRREVSQRETVIGLGCPRSVAGSDRLGIQQDNGYPAQCRKVLECSVNVGSFHTLSYTSLSTTSAKCPSLDALRALAQDK